MKDKLEFTNIYKYKSFLNKLKKEEGKFITHGHRISISHVPLITNIEGITIISNDTSTIIKPENKIYLSG